MCASSRPRRDRGRRRPPDQRLGLQRRPRHRTLPRLAEENGLDPFTRGSGIYVHSVTRGTISRNYFRPGDIIRSVNGKQTKTVKELQAVLKANTRDWDIEIERNGRIVRGTVRT